MIKLAGKNLSLISRIARNSFSIVFLSTILTTVFIIGIFEAAQNIKYYKWRAEYDNSGWVGKITIPSDNEEMMWEYAPYSSIHQISTNKYGFRDIDYEAKDKPSHVYRIGFVGDSVTLGLNVGFNKIFTRQFESKAKSLFPSKTIQAMNFGIDGYNTPQILALVKSKVLDYSPNHIVYVMCLNDFDFTDSAGEKLLYFRKPASFFWRNIEQYLEKSSNQDFHLYKFIKNKDVVFDSIYKMDEFLGLNGVEFTVVVVPVFGDYGFGKNYPLTDMHKEIYNVLKSRNIGVVDLLDDFKKSDKNYSYFSHDIWHPNDAGHEFIADRMLRPVLSDL